MFEDVHFHMLFFFFCFFVIGKSAPAIKRRTDRKEHRENHRNATALVTPVAQARWRIFGRIVTATALGVKRLKQRESFLRVVARLRKESERQQLNK